MKDGKKKMRDLKKHLKGDMSMFEKEKKEDKTMLKKLEKGKK